MSFLKHSHKGLFVCRTLTTLLFYFFALSLFADDVIVFRNGDIVNAFVTEVSSNEIKYKKASNPDGPVYSENKGNILSIKYSNGEIDKFEDAKNTNTNTSSNTTNSKTRTKANPAEDNEEQKAQYAELPRLNLKQSNKKSKDFFPIMAFTDSSVISTKDILIKIEPNAVEFYDGGWKVKIGYSLRIVNKSESPIYIDRANCFKRDCDYETKSFFDNKQYTVSNSDNSGFGIGVGLGAVGVGVGGSSGSTYSESHGVERILVIGPRSKANLVDYKYIRLSEKKAKFKTVSDIEYWGFDFLSGEPIKQGEVKTYSESESPYSNKYYITYSTDPDFKNCYTIDFELYAKFIVGAKMKEAKWSMTNPTANIVGEIQKIVPDFYTKGWAIIGTPGQYK